MKNRGKRIDPGLTAELGQKQNGLMLLLLRALSTASNTPANVTTSSIAAVCYCSNTFMVISMRVNCYGYICEKIHDGKCSNVIACMLPQEVRERI